MEDPNIDIQYAVNKAAWVHNTNLSHTGFTPLQIATGQGSKIPTGGIEKINDEIKAVSEKEQIEQVLKVQRMFMEAEVDRMIEN